MKITKHGHACLELAQDGKKIVLDPGAYTEDMVGLENVVAVVITHKHDDHCFEPQLERILKLNPEALIFGTKEVCERLSQYKTTTVTHGDWHTVGPFTLEFFGDLHEPIHRSIPIIQNTGVMINDALYYPGDSYTLPDKKVEILACPTSAPWLRIAEVIDFVENIKPKRSFPTHNALLSEKGHKLNNSRVEEFTKIHGGEFRYLEVGDSWEL
jgi:L-ascorbate metabolism protein UlaG (beta-lactamase superfamily)